MKILVINGPNLNLLGMRETDIYGSATYDELCKQIRDHADAIGITVEIYQSNHEGDLVDAIQSAYGTFDGLILNPAAYTHTSIALLDALQAVRIPAIEVHLTDINLREPFRSVSYIRSACNATIVGHGIRGYLEAMDLLVSGEARP